MDSREEAILYGHCMFLQNLSLIGGYFGTYCVLYEPHRLSTTVVYTELCSIFTYIQRAMYIPVISTLDIRKPQI